MDIYNRGVSNKLDVKYIMKWLDLYNEFIHCNFSQNISCKEYNKIITIKSENFFLE